MIKLAFQSLIPVEFDFQKRERRNSFDTSSLSRTHNISIHPVVEPKPAFDRVTSATPGHPAAQKSKTKAILRRVSSLGLSRKGSPSNALSRKGSLKEKSNKSKQVCRIMISNSAKCARLLSKVLSNSD